MDSAHGGGDVLESPSTVTSRLTERWSTLPRERRITVTAVLSGVVGAILLSSGAVFVNGWLAERALDDQVALRASLGVTASSMAAGGGRVDYFASVRNTGTRPVSVTAVRIRAHRLLIGSQPLELPVAPGAMVHIPLSVRLDCIDRSRGEPPTVPGLDTEALAGLIGAVPPSGRQRSVPTAFGAAVVVTRVADTLCAARPELRNLELDGPVG